MWGQHGVHAQVRAESEKLPILSAPTMALLIPFRPSTSVWFLSCKRISGWTLSLPIAFNLPLPGSDAHKVRCNPTHLRLPTHPEKHHLVLASLLGK